MYVKPSRKQIHGVYVPENYHGTAFDEQEGFRHDAPSFAPVKESDEASTAHAQEPDAKKAESAGLSSLFSGLGSLRSDDILLLALILLLARSDSHGQSAADLLPMLAILLFIG